MAKGAQTATAEVQDKSTPVSPYIEEIKLYERETAKWKQRREKIVKRYKDERDEAAKGAVRFNVLWSITQTLRPALYARNPKPDIQRRFKDADPVGRVTSSVLERCVGYFTDTDKFGSCMAQCTLDYILPGRGTTWLRYEPTIVSETAEITDDAVAGEDAAPPVERLAYEDVETDYVHPSDFGHNICRTWEELWLVYRIVYLTRAELVKRFGEKKGKLAPLDHREKNDKGATIDDGIGKATIYEAWDKSRMCAVWFHMAVPEFLDEQPDPLELKDFFPCPKPLLANLANDSLIPTPEYMEYQDQAAELDNITARIASITKSLKVAGVYAGNAQAVGRLLSEGVENQLVPVEEWAMFVDKGGLKGVMEFLPLADIANALKALYEARERVKQDLYEITGIADIIRGASEAEETATAQQIKSNFATMRLGDKQREVQRFVRENIRIMVDIIAGHFSLETIKTISGVRLFDSPKDKQAFQAPPVPGAPPPQPPPGVSQDQLETMLTDPTWEEVYALIKNDALRNFRIDIETDSTIKSDEEQDKRSRIEFIEAIGKYMGQALPAAEGNPQLLPFLAQGLQFLARGFPVGKEFEGTINTMIAKLEKVAANPQQKPDPEMAKVNGQMQIEQMKEQNAQQRAMAEINAKSAEQQHLNELEAARRAQEIHLEDQAAEREAQRQADLQRDQWAHEQVLARTKGDTDIAIAERKALIAKEQAIEVARINAAATTGEDEEGRAEAQTDEAMGGEPVKPARDDELHGKLDDLVSALSEHLNRPQPDFAGALQELARAQAAQGDAISGLHKAVSAEKEIVRDPKTGKASGVRLKPDPAQMGRALQ